MTEQEKNDHAATEPTLDELRATLAEREQTIAQQAELIATLQQAAAEAPPVAPSRPRGGAMSPRVGDGDGGSSISIGAQSAAESALASGKRVDLLRYLRLRRQAS
jgi:hypothetical protein